MKKPKHDCAALDCDVAVDGTARRDLTVRFQDRDGKEGSYSVKAGERTGELGKGLLKNATTAWTERA